MKTEHSKKPIPITDQKKNNSNFIFYWFNWLIKKVKAGPKSANFRAMDIFFATFFFTKWPLCGMELTTKKYPNLDLPITK